MQNSSRGGRLRFSLAAVAIVGAAVGVGWGIGRFHEGRGAPGARRGALLFQTSCASCHGPEGRGDGEAASGLGTPPRDFAVRPWRFEASAASIRRVILQGIPGTAMPAARGTFKEDDVDALVAYVLSLATARTPIEYRPPADEQLARNAGFTPLHGVESPPLTLVDAAGQVMKLADVRGQLVVVNFWGTTCVPCLHELPRLRDLAAAHAGRGLIVLHVCTDTDDPTEAQEVLDKHAPGGRALTDATGLGLARFEVQMLPTVWLIGPDGKAIARASGALDWQAPALVRLIDHYLSQP